GHSNAGRGGAGTYSARARSVRRQSDRRRAAPRHHASNAGEKARRGARLIVLLENEIVAPILRPGGLVVAVIFRLLGAVAHRLDTRRRHAQAQKIFLGGIGAMGAEAEVVFLRPALITVAFDADFRARIRFDLLRELLQQRT